MCAGIVRGWLALRLTRKLSTFYLMNTLLKILCGLAFFWYLPCTAGSANPETLDRVQALTLRGLEDAYNFDFDNAAGRFDEAISLDPSFPRPHVVKAAIRFWRYLLSRNDSDYQPFLSLADEAIQVSEKYLDEHGNNAEALGCLGTVYGYRAFAEVRAKSWLKAAWDGKRSYDCLYDAIKLDPHLYDAYLGLGLYHYYVTVLPKPLQWIISILGVSGDSELGFKEIRTTAEKGTYARTEAKYYLAVLLPWHSGDFDGSEKIFADLSLHYPNNSLFIFSRAVWEIRRNDVHTAKDRLLAILAMPNSALPGVDTYVHYKLAECYFRLEDWPAALTEYQASLNRNRDETYSTTSSYRIGLCYEMSGQRNVALPYYQRAATGNLTFGDDAYSLRRAQERLKSPLALPDTLLIRAQNALRTGNDEKAITLFTSLKNIPLISPDCVGEAEYGIGEALFDRGAYGDALRRFQSVLGLTLTQEGWLLPWSHYQSALCHLKLNNTQSAKNELERALEYDNYDFKNWIEFRAKRELEELGKNSG